MNIILHSSHYFLADHRTDLGGGVRETRQPGLLQPLALRRSRFPGERKTRHRRRAFQQCRACPLLTKNRLPATVEIALSMSASGRE